MEIARWLAGALLVFLGVALQFEPHYRARLAPLLARYPALALMRSRVFQLLAGFALLYAGIVLLR